MRKLKILLSVCFFVFSFTGFAQVVISGRVANANDNSGVSFASVFLQKNSMGTATSVEGNYRLELSSLNNIEDTLIIRCVGYKEKRIPILLLENRNLNVYLKPMSVSLREFTVIGSEEKYTVDDILLKVRKSVKKNYVSSNTNYEGNYREVLLENDVAIKFNEATFQLSYSGYPENRLSKKTFNNYWNDYHESSKYKSNPYLSYFAQNWPVFISDKNEVNIIESRVSLNTGSSDGSISTLGDPLGGPIDLVGMDNLKFGLHFFDKKLQDSYSFKLKGKKILFDTISTFVIEFYPKQEGCYRHNWSKKVDYPAFQGEIYVKDDDFSVIHFKCSSVDWLNTISMCQNMRNQHPAYKGYKPTRIQYEVYYQFSKLGWTLGRVEYKSRNETEKGVYSWERSLQLSKPSKSISKFEAENKFSIHHESLRYRTSSYNQKYWSDYDNTRNNFGINENYKEDLEKMTPLENQFILLNRSIKSIPKPSIDSAYYDNVSVVSRNGISNDLKASNLYASSVLQKLVNDEKKFLNKTSMVLKWKDYDYEKNLYPKYKIDADSTYNYHYYELSDDSIYVPIFNITRENKENYLEKIQNIDFTKDLVLVTKQGVGSFVKKLKIVAKDTEKTIDSIANLSTFLIVNDSTILSVTTSKTGRSDKLYLKVMGGVNQLLLSETDENYEIELSNTVSDQYAVIDVTSKNDNKIYVLDKSNLVLKGIDYFENQSLMAVDHFSGKALYILRNKKEIYRIDITNINSSPELIYSSNKLIEEFYVSENKLLISEYHLFDMSLKVIDTERKKVLKIHEGEEFDFIELIKPRDNSKPLKISFESKIHPSITYQYDFKSLKLSKTEEDELAFWSSSGNYVSQLVYSESKDGFSIPILVTFDKNAIKDSISACLFKVYGAYGNLEYSLFQKEDVVLMKEGFILVNVGVRGTALMGSEWYDAGKLLNKKNSFDDFITSVRFIQNKFNLESRQIFAKGVSAGGLVMGDMVNHYSNNFGGIILDRPFLDVYNLMSDSLNFLTTLEYTEWGNPLDTTYAKYILEYSPLQNIPDRINCNIFMRGSYLDYVTPIEQIALSSFRYSSRIDDDKLNLFKIDYKMGHMIEYNLKRSAEEFAFMKYCLKK